MDYIVRPDCRNFKGKVPCSPNKLYNVTCGSCSYYEQYSDKILIIKLGAAGDVIRTTTLLARLRKEYPAAKVFWLTDYPELVPVSGSCRADVVLKMDFKAVMYLRNISFDLAINLDKENEAIALMKELNAKKKKGFVQSDDYCFAANAESEGKFLTGIFDNLSKENTKNYMEEIFEIAGYDFQNEKYILNPEKEFDRYWPLDRSKPVIGLNTGVGSRWVSRLWNTHYWEELINRLSADYEVLLLGGSQEDMLNTHLAESTGAKYFGHFDLKTFINLVNKCDIIVTQVTMTMHIAIGLEKNIVLMNNIFNEKEFYLYGLGEIVSPEKKCKCYFGNTCTNSRYRCMDYIRPDTVYDKVNEIFSNRNNYRISS